MLGAEYRERSIQEQSIVNRVSWTEYREQSIVNRVLEQSIDDRHFRESNRVSKMNRVSEYRWWPCFPEMNRVSEYRWPRSSRNYILSQKWTEYQSIGQMNRVSGCWTEYRWGEQSIKVLNRVSVRWTEYRKQLLPVKNLTYRGQPCIFSPVEFTIGFWVSNNEGLVNLIDLSFPLL